MARPVILFKNASGRSAWVESVRSKRLLVELGKDMEKPLTGSVSVSENMGVLLSFSMRQELWDSCKQKLILGEKM